MINLTPKAIAKIKEISEGEGIGHYCVRVSVKGAGCSGYAFELNYDDNISDIDETFDIDGVKIIVDGLSLNYADNTTVDYIESPFSGGFQFSGGDIKSSCGCGKSYEF